MLKRDKFEEDCQEPYFTVSQTGRIVWIYNANDHVFEHIAEWFPGDKAREIFVWSGKVSHINIPEGNERFTAERICLRTVYVPDSVKTLTVSCNALRELELPAGIEFARLDYNELERITFRGKPESLYRLDVYSNRLESLYFEVPETLTEVSVGMNGRMSNEPEIPDMCPGLRDAWLRKFEIKYSDSESGDDAVIDNEKKRKKPIRVPSWKPNRYLFKIV